KDKTYYMFFLFAKRTTKQTYQIYVGPGFNVDTDFKTFQISVNTLPVSGNPIMPFSWPGAVAHYNDSTACPTTPDCGILQVTVDFKDVSAVDTVAANGLCLPHNFCPNENDKCGCALQSDDPLAVANPNIIAECGH